MSNPVNLFFGRYMDDLGTLASSKEKAWEMLNLISDQDPRGLLKWELDYPESQDGWIPFLDTQLNIDGDGNLHHKYYRKPQKKNITLNFNSHHQFKTKVEVAKNFYRTAEICSSCDEYLEESNMIVDKLLRCNGFDNPRSYIDFKSQKPLYSSNFGQTSDQKSVCLTLPYISENICTQIKRYILSHNLPINVVFTPGKKLRDLFCTSRPYDRRKCINNQCKICPNLNKGNCQVIGPIYKITCNVCSMFYIGESSRTAHERLMEHCRFAASPDTYPEEALAKHYKLYHLGVQPDLNFEILDIIRGTVKRKIREAFYIINLKPGINDKEECKILDRFLIK